MTSRPSPCTSSRLCCSRSSCRASRARAFADRGSLTPTEGRPARRLLIDLVEPGLEVLGVLLDLVVVDRDELDLPEGRIPRRGLDVGPAGVDPLPGQELLHRVAD